jgi:hypothetical protein
MTFRPEILDELARHGLQPRPDTSPARLREQINDLYRIEIRALRDRCRAGEFPIHELPNHVVELRRRYILLSIPMENWIEPGPPSQAD